MTSTLWPSRSFWSEGAIFQLRNGWGSDEDMRRRKRGAKSSWQKSPQRIDFQLLFYTLTILAFGLVMVLSSGSVLGYNTKNQNSYYYFWQQLKWVGIGSLLALVAIRFPFYHLRKLSGVAYLVTLALLVAVLFSDAGVTSKGSSRWLNLGPIGIQPSEIAKITIALVYAHLLSYIHVKTLKSALIPLALAAPVIALVLRQPDLGTATVLGLTCVVMLWQTELRTRWFALAIPSIMVAAFYMIKHTSYQWDRILAWLDPWKYASGLGYQITNAEIAFGSGGLFGVGLGRSLQKYGFLPENHTDMIYAIIGEEWGLLGTVLLLYLFVRLYTRGYQIARACPDRFGRLLAFGITSALAMQTAINLAVVTGLFPVTGITLPLVSYGGSSLSVTLLEIGVLLNISRYREIPAETSTDRNPHLAV